MGYELVERDGALATIRAALARGTETFASVAIDGPAGFGKSALLHRVLAGDDRAVLRMDGELELVRAPLCAVASLTGRTDLLEAGAEADVDTELAIKTARAVGALLDLVAERISAAGAVVIVVDDLQWIDRPSVDVLRLSAGRLRSEPCTMVLAGRPAPGRDDIAALIHVLDELGGDAVHLGPLADDAARRLVLQHSPAARPPDIDRCVAAAGGSPLLLRHLARSLGTGGEIEGSPLASATRRMLAGLTDAARRQVKLAAVGGTEIDVGAVAALTDHDRDAVVDGLRLAADAGLVRHDGGWRFEHDLIRAAVLDTLPSDEIDRLRRAWAAQLSASGEAGRQAAADHLMAVDAEWSDAEIDVVVAAAGSIVVTGSDRAAELFRALVDRTPPSDPRHRTARSGLAEARLWSGKLASSDARAEVDPLTRLRHELAVGRVSTSTLHDAEAHARRIHEGPRRDEALARVAKMGATALHPLPHLVAELEQRVDELTPLAEVRLWSAKADLLMLAGDFLGYEWIGERARAAADQLPEHHPARIEAAAVSGRLAMQTAAHAERGLDELAWAEQRAEELGSTRLQIAVHVDHGNALHMWGRLDEADARLAAGADLARDSGDGTMVQQFEWRRLKVLLERGELDTAEELLDSHRGLPDPHGLTAIEIANLHLLRGASAQAVDILVPLATSSDAMPEIRRVTLERLAHAAFDADDDAARQAVVDGARLLDGDSLPIVFSRSMALAAAEGDVELAESAWAATSDVSPPPYIQDLGTRLAAITHHRAGNDTRAVDLLLRARALEERAGAFGVATMVDRWLVRLGHAPARPRENRPATGWDALTPAELRVVEVVAEGHVYREVAEQLCLSRRTVESHVAAALRKLGLKNRSQLAAAFVSRQLGKPVP